jgi:heme A synthase
VVGAALLWTFTRSHIFAFFAVLAGIALSVLYYISGPQAEHTGTQAWWLLHDVRAEHGHRLIAGTVGFLTFILCAVVWARDERKSLHMPMLFTLLVLGVQGLLGGLTVRYQLPSLLSSSHGFMAQVFLGLVVALTAQLQASWREERAALRQEANEKPLHKRCRLLLIALYVQISMGAAVRHSPYYSDTGEGMSVFMWHLGAHFLGFLWLGHAVFTTSLAIFRKENLNRAFGKYAGILLALFSIQALFGFGVGFFRLTHTVEHGPSTLRETIMTIHVGIGALLVTIAVWLRMQVKRWVAPLESERNVALETDTQRMPGLPS